MWAGIYHGPDKPAEVTVSMGGRTVSARMVVLPGRPGWVAFHAYDTQAGNGTNDISITVQGTDGAILASLAKPAKG